MSDRSVAYSACKSYLVDVTVKWHMEEFTLWQTVLDILEGSGGIRRSWVSRIVSGND